MDDLTRLIEAHESAVGRDYEARLNAQRAARAALDQLLRRQDAELGQQPPHGEEVQSNESSKRD